MNVQFRDLDIEAATAGSIQFAENWSFAGLRMKIGDGGSVALKDSREVTGLPAR